MYIFQFLQTFFSEPAGEKSSDVVICTACRLKLDNFKLFWLQFKTNVNLLNVFRARQQEQRRQAGRHNTVLDDVIRQRLGSLTPLTPLTPLDFSVQKREAEAELPDTSTPALLHHEASDRSVSPASPLPSTGAGLDTLVFALGAEGRGGGGDERRRQRNREASRRYRERARSNPELLRRMREQQNARQKKYYARLRQRKQSSASSMVRTAHVYMQLKVLSTRVSVKLFFVCSGGQ